MIKAKNCPFCGSNRLTHVSEPINLEDFAHYISCIDCTASGPAMVLPLEDDCSTDEIVKRWNERNYNAN